MKRLEPVQKVWTALEAEMSNALERTRTALVIKNVQYNVGLQDADFSRRALEAGGK